MNYKDPLKELKRKQFYNDYKELEDKFKKGEKLNINGIDYGVESICACFDTSELELRLIHIGEPLKYLHKKEFKAGDKVKLNQHIPAAMNRAIGYRKYYEVVRTENIQINKTKTEQFLAIDGVKGLTSAEYFDLYVEDEDRDFTLDELVFIQGHLGSISDEFENELSIESDNKRLDLLKRKIDTIKNINKKITKLFMRY